MRAIRRAIPPDAIFPCSGNPEDATETGYIEFYVSDSVAEKMTKPEAPKRLLFWNYRVAKNRNRHIQHFARNYFNNYMDESWDRFYASDQDYRTRNIHSFIDWSQERRLQFNVNIQKIRLGHWWEINRIWKVSL